MYNKRGEPPLNVAKQCKSNRIDLSQEARLISGLKYVLCLSIKLSTVWQWQTYKIQMTLQTFRAYFSFCCHFFVVLSIRKESNLLSC